MTSSLFDARSSGISQANSYHQHWGTCMLGLIKHAFNYDDQWRIQELLVGGDDVSCLLLPPPPFVSCLPPAAALKSR